MRTNGFRATDRGACRALRADKDQVVAIGYYQRRGTAAPVSNWPCPRGAACHRAHRARRRPGVSPLQERPYADIIVTGNSMLELTTKAKTKAKRKTFGRSVDADDRPAGSDREATAGERAGKASRPRSTCVAGWARSPLIVAKDSPPDQGASANTRKSMYRNQPMSTSASGPGAHGGRTESSRGERAYDIYSRLLKDRIVFVVVGPVEDSGRQPRHRPDLVPGVGERRTRTSTCTSTRPGGAVTSGTGHLRHDAVRATATSARCASARPPAWAPSCLAAGEPRQNGYALPNSRMMIHQPSRWAAPGALPPTSRSRPEGDPAPCGSG